MKKMRVIFLSLLCFVFLAGFTSPVSADSLLYFNPSLVESNPGENPSVDIVMEGSYNGISGYALLVSIDNNQAGSLGKVTFPPWAALNKAETINSTTVLVQAADLADHIAVGAPAEPLAKITLHALKAGYITLHVEPVIIDDDMGGRYYPVCKTASLVISGAGPIPGRKNEPIPVIPASG